MRPSAETLCMVRHVAMSNRQNKRSKSLEASIFPVSLLYKYSPPFGTSSN